MAAALRCSLKLSSRLNRLSPEDADIGKKLKGTNTDVEVVPRDICHASSGVSDRTQGMGVIYIFRDLRLKPRLRLLIDIHKPQVPCVTASYIMSACDMNKPTHDRLLQGDGFNEVVSLHKEGTGSYCCGRSRD